MNGGFLFLSLILLVLFGILSCVVSQQTQFDTCSQPFRCGGSVGDIPYPFYGANRPVSCGAEGYEITCRDNVPLINTSSLFYRVLNIDDQARTLRVARDDLWSSPCEQTQQLPNTTLNTTFFNFYQPSNDQNITLAYGCTVPPSPSQTRLPNQFDCSGTSAFFFTSTIELTGSSIICTGPQVIVRVTQSAAEGLRLESNPSVDLLESSLKTGFSIQWLVDDNQNCQRCLVSGGACGSDGSGSFVCHCSNNTSVPSTCSNGNNCFSLSFISLPHHCI